MRRQKRMIKNRESAARSRARKQVRSLSRSPSPAYTNELENKISRLEEEIEHLKELKKLEPVMQFLPQQEAGGRQQQLRRHAVLYMPQPEAEPKQHRHQLRRVNSASF
ncbi:ABSCISIC ACID-INSENSITIVE 5-like protein 3 [Triticum urartu]|uniref:ABSCISIC ACID-INSENSITIVE 5-like protein 3 n=1 Tax=Triticum urartu TaxID=4572 RepID=M7YBP9_TRIUA|nr:ABSCISIC ACID-INSENSITIVE 5-like protein 3 [Triticum urartu]